MPTSIEFFSGDAPGRGELCNGFITANCAEGHGVVVQSFGPYENGTYLQWQRLVSTYDRKMDTHQQDMDTLQQKPKTKPRGPSPLTVEGLKICLSESVMIGIMQKVFSEYYPEFIKALDATVKQNALQPCSVTSSQRDLTSVLIQFRSVTPEVCQALTNFALAAINDAYSSECQGKAALKVLAIVLPIVFAVLTAAAGYYGYRNRECIRRTFHEKTASLSLPKSIFFASNKAQTAGSTVHPQQNASQNP